VLKEDPSNGSFVVEGLQRLLVVSEQEALYFYEQGIKNRATKSSMMNNKSSRSHAIFEIYLEKESKKDKSQKTISKLRIVDLAGSEKCSVRNLYSMKNQDKHINELTSINGSLSSLGQCISALADIKRTHIPFRNSKLTKVLKDSLEISSKIALIICISPSIDSYKETVSTLQFADRAKKAILHAQNEPKPKLRASSSASKWGDDAMISNKQAYNKIKELMVENEKLRHQINLYKKSSTSTLDIPVRSTDNLHKNFDAESMSIFAKKLSKKKKKGKRKKVDYLNKFVSNAEKPTKSRNYIDRFQTLQNMKVSTSMRSLRISSSVKNRKPIKKREFSSLRKKQEKHVTFNDRLLNESSLDDDLKDRMEHNQRYNDDTIFNNFSIYQQLTNPEESEQNEDLVCEEPDIPKHPQIDENSMQRLVTPFTQHFDRSINQIENPDKQISINVQNPAMLKLQEHSPEQDDLVSYTAESPEEQHNIINLKQEPSIIESSKNEEPSLFQPSFSNITDDASDMNNIVEGINDFDIFGQKETGNKIIIADDLKEDPITQVTTIITKPKEYQIINIQSNSEDFELSEESQSEDEGEEGRNSSGDREPQANSNPNDDQNDSIQSITLDHDKPKPNLFIKIEEDESQDSLGKVMLNGCINFYRETIYP
jgi:hypothetical protein